MWTRDTEVLRSGSEGDLVAMVQKGLMSLGYETGDVDGRYGPQTVAAVKRFQNDNGLVADGVIGFTTGIVLERIYNDHTGAVTAQQPAGAGKAQAAVKASFSKPMMKGKK